MSEEQKTVDINEVADQARDTVNGVPIGEPANEQAVNAVDSATMMFGLYYPKLEMLVNRMSNKSLKRVIRALVGMPLETVKLNLKLQQEKTAYAIADQLIQAKMTLMIHTAYESEMNRQKLLASKAEEKATEVVENSEPTTENK
jgi:hypothetical protein